MPLLKDLLLSGNQFSGALPIELLEIYQVARIDLVSQPALRLNKLADTDHTQKCTGTEQVDWHHSKCDFFPQPLHDPLGRQSAVRITSLVCSISKSPYGGLVQQ